jgi:predicted DNA-binding transcriptional regulator YafY
MVCIRRNAARDLIAKIATALPERLRLFIAEPTIGAPPGNVLPLDGLDIARTRLWIRSRRKIRIRYPTYGAEALRKTVSRLACLVVRATASSRMMS